ncbi:phage regulatory protein/antirepressor Ant [Clostridium sp.]|uniref:phage regulatory protein/antirepressor Ant n=1 Tax=Clostridium sp. TaxID=1506 RepID=UPI001DAA628B|nr:phage regulatory protein/antirepressor Ant [Clostridium sp.]MBS5985263.1 phage regulatory protein/antirepressor Ant [Clostridium sp.]
MNNLINVTNYNVATIDSREVAEMLGKEHSTLLKDIQGSGKNLGLIPILLKGNFHVSDYFMESSYKDASGKTNKCYLVTKMGCEMLGNKQQGEKGILFTAKYVERFNKMEQALRNQVPQLSEKQQCILAIYDGGQGAIQGAKRLSEIEIAEAVAPLEAKLEEQAPRVAFANRVSASEESITLEEFAKVISDNKFKISKIRLMELLLKRGYLNKSKGKSEKLPSQYAIDRDMLELIEIPYQDAYGRNRLSKKTMVTSKGQEHIFKKIDRWIKEEELELEERRKVIELAQQDMHNEILIVRGI